MEGAPIPPAGCSVNFRSVCCATCGKFFARSLSDWKNMMSRPAARASDAQIQARGEPKTVIFGKVSPNSDDSLGDAAILASRAWRTISSVKSRPSVFGGSPCTACETERNSWSNCRAAGSAAKRTSTVARSSAESSPSR